MKLKHVLYLILFLVVVPVLSFAQNIDRSLGYRSVTNLSNEELSTIYSTVIQGKKLSYDQSISYGLVMDSFPPLTQQLFLSFSSNAKELGAEKIDISALWKSLQPAIWIQKDDFKSHAYYFAFYCIYLSTPLNQGIASFQQGVNNQFIHSMRDFIGCADLKSRLDGEIEDHNKFVSDNWQILDTTASTK